MGGFFNPPLGSRPRPRGEQAPAQQGCVSWLVATDAPVEEGRSPKGGFKGCPFNPPHGERGVKSWLAARGQRRLLGTGCRQWARAHLRNAFFPKYPS